MAGKCGPTPDNGSTCTGLHDTGGMERLDFMPPSPSHKLHAWNDAPSTLSGVHRKDATEHAWNDAPSSHTGVHRKDATAYDWNDALFSLTGVHRKDAMVQAWNDSPSTCTKKNLSFWDGLCNRESLILK